MADKGNLDGEYSIGVDKEIEKGPYSYTGTFNAPHTGGFVDTFNYRNWELNLNFFYNLGAYVKTDPTYCIVDPDPGRNMNRDILDRWTLENKSEEFPALTSLNINPADYYLFSTRRGSYKPLDIWVRKSGYIRLQNIRLAYHLPSERLHKLSIGGATVGLEARNLFVFGSSCKNYMDSELTSNPYPTPVPKPVTFNLSLNL